MAEERKNNVYTPEFKVKVAKEVDASNGDTRAVALRYKIPYATAEGWFLKLKVHGEEWLRASGRPVAEKKENIKLASLERRIARIEAAFDIDPKDHAAQ